MLRLGLKLGLLFLLSTLSAGWAPPSTGSRVSRRTSAALLHASVEEKEQVTARTVEETTEKYGLEVGLVQSLKQKDGGAETAKSLLKKYGVAYLATSIPLAIISFAVCYALVDQGVDVGALLSKIGIESTKTGETAGTFAIAYAAHKAASPIRFPPTVLLTPVVAKWIGKEPMAGDDQSSKSQ